MTDAFLSFEKETHTLLHHVLEELQGVSEHVYAVTQVQEDARTIQCVLLLFDQRRTVRLTFSPTTPEEHETAQQAWIEDQVEQIEAVITELEQQEAEGQREVRAALCTLSDAGMSQPEIGTWLRNQLHPLAADLSAAAWEAVASHFFPNLKSRGVPSKASPQEKNTEASHDQANAL